ncbi:hypothetical protein CWATWH0402_461 [Crocosphaera watsonii WH 0402]|uniref:Uncharacterized protein n=1 Tax=Crocosphaera watsonii WH 0402 TaxID=1284629 RepID=T2JSV8_CROWT|nr:hypothetical protein CWATWH0402_461 [Crocosphaera watsonii WH 0402]
MKQTKVKNTVKPPSIDIIFIVLDNEGGTDKIHLLLMNFDLYRYELFHLKENYS